VLEVPFPPFAFSIFTFKFSNHNRLFLDVFETSKENHICKTIDTDCNNLKGRHVRVYQVNSEGQDSKGVLANYKLNKAKNHISEANKLLEKSPFEDNLKVASLLRKCVSIFIVPSSVW
jgi:hypothetical protein